MGKHINKSPPIPGSRKSLRLLKVVTIVSPVSLIFLLELVRQYFFRDTLPLIWSAVALAIIFAVAAFFFSRFVFSVIDHQQKDNIQRMGELATLNDISQTIDEFHELNDLLSRALAKLIQITGADCGELYLVDGQNRELIHSLHGGALEDAFERQAQSKLKECLTGKGKRLYQQVIIEGPEDFQRGNMTFLRDAGVTSLATIPLNSRNSTVGIVCLFSLNPDHFKSDEANLLLNIGNRIAIAVEKARLYEKVQAVAVLEERERISAELHDGLAQVLGYVITKSQATRQLLRKMTLAADYLAELENVAQEVYTDTREAILGLRTAISGDRSMVTALREYANRFNQMHGIKTELSVSDRVIPSLSPQIELQAIRIVQEALSNIRKHAEATRVKINVVAEDDEVSIVIEDDGKGFDVEKADGNWTKFGLRNMKDRAKSIHGRLLVESGPESGTRVTLHIPLISSQQAEGGGGEEIENIDS